MPDTQPQISWMETLRSLLDKAGSQEPSGGDRTRRIKELEGEVASWITGIELLEEEIDEIISSEGSLDEATARRAEELGQLLQLRLDEAIEALQRGLAEIEV